MLIYVLKKKVLEDQARESFPAHDAQKEKIPSAIQRRGIYAHALRQFCQLQAKLHPKKDCARQFPSHFVSLLLSSPLLSEFWTGTNSSRLHEWTSQSSLNPLLLQLKTLPGLLSKTLIPRPGLPLAPIWATCYPIFLSISQTISIAASDPIDTQSTPVLLVIGSGQGAFGGALLGDLPIDAEADQDERDDEKYDHDCEDDF